MKEDSGLSNRRGCHPWRNPSETGLRLRSGALAIAIKKCQELLDQLRTRMSMQEPRELDFALAISEISVLLQRILTRSKAWSSRNKSETWRQSGRRGTRCWMLGALALRKRSFFHGPPHQRGWPRQRQPVHAGRPCLSASASWSRQGRFQQASS